MQFINVLEQLGNWDNRSHIDGTLNGILDRLIPDVREVNGLPIKSPDGVLAIIRVASVSTFTGEQYCAGEMMVVLSQRYAEPLVGRPVKVENSPNRGGKIRKAYSREFHPNSGVHIFKMTRHETGYALVNSFVGELSPTELRSKGLTGVLVPGEDVHWEQMAGITSVPVFYGLNQGYGGKRVILTHAEKRDSFTGTDAQYIINQETTAEGKILEEGETERLIDVGGTEQEDELVTSEPLNKANTGVPEKVFIEPVGVFHEVYEGGNAGNTEGTVSTVSTETPLSTTPKGTETTHGTTTSDQSLVHRSQIKAYNPIVTALEADHEEQTKLLNALSSEIHEWVMSLPVGDVMLDEWASDVTGVCRNFREKYLKQFGSRINGDNSEDLVKKVAEGYNTMLHAKNRLLDGFSLDKVDIQDLCSELRFSENAWKQRTMTNPSEESILVLDAVLGMSTLVKLYGYCKSLPKTQYYLEALLLNPYKTAVLLGMSLLEADKWYVVRESSPWILKGTDNDEVEIIRWREYLKLLSSFINNKEDITLLGNSDIRTAYYNEVQTLSRQGGKPWRGKTIDTRLENLGLGNKEGSWTSLNNLTNDTLKASTVSFCINNGLISEVDDKKILTTQAIKEVSIYNMLYDKGSEGTGISDEIIENTIKEFEEMKGFTLENLQRDGIGLVKYKAAVLSGCAGSGKTTVSEGMTMCIERGFEAMGVPVEIFYAAPTGKAARRLAEVVGRPVKTLHSLLKIGLGGNDEGYLGVEDTRKGSGDSGEKGGSVKVFLFDEMAMANMNLLYEVIRRLPENSCVYFLGDIKQLKPIGKGIPFKDILGYLPAVELGVSKRSAEGSGINYNCDVINRMSVPGEGWGKIEEREDFQLIECADSRIKDSICDEVKSLLDEGWSADDIQVVTPYTGSLGKPEKGKKVRQWAAAQINPDLQRVLNTNEPLLTRGWTPDTEITFRLNDRVIHVNTNRWGYRRYVELKDNGDNGTGATPGVTNGVRVFQEVETTGVANGEVGHILGYVESTDVVLHLLDNSDGSASGATLGVAEGDTSSRGGVTLRDDLLDQGVGMYYILVEFYDPDIERDVVVFYHAREKKVQEAEAKGKEFYNGDMEDLQLAYALTTHKMQGSQSPVVIVPLSSGDNTTFVNRNMVYTAISRASKKVLMVGSVKGPQSTLEKSRVKFSSEKETLLRVLTA